MIINHIKQTVLPKITRLVFALTLLFILAPTSVLALSASTTTASLPTTHTFGLTASNCTAGGFFGLEPWYQYLPDDYFDTSATDACGLKCFNVLPQSAGNDCGSTHTGSDVPKVLLAVIDDLLRVAGIAAVAFVVYGSIRYTTSQGDPESTSQAQTTIINALLGMAIAMISILVVSFIGNALK